MRASLLLLFLSTTLNAAVLVEPSIRWSDFTFRPEGTEDTVNYYGYGGQFGVGYSWTDSFETTFIAQYQPGKRITAGFLSPHAVTNFFGPNIGIRFAKILVLDFRFGYQTYSLNDQKFPTEVPGSWAGPAGGISFGFVASAEKDNFWQISVDVMESVLKNPENPEPVTRRLDSFGVSATFVYNDPHGHKGGHHDGLFDQLKF